MTHPTNPGSEQDRQLFAGRYKKVELLGAGGMGTVWLAEKSGPGNFSQHVVIKQIHEHMAKQPEFVTRFQDEARLAGLLHHPNIVRVEDFGNADGVLYLVMEHVQGAELQELVQSHGQLPLPIVLAMAIDIAKALSYAHDLKDFEGKALQVVHRDVSPQNIMITRTGESKLLDFGIARATSNQVETRVGVVKGKLGYLSPEQVEGRPLDGRSDQFTLGIVLYELLCGGRLFDGKSDLGILTRIQKADVPHLGRLATDLPEGLTSIVMRCLQRMPSARFDDCGQLAKALNNTLRSLGGRLPTEAFEAWWQEASVAGDPHTMRDMATLDHEGPPDGISAGRLVSRRAQEAVQEAAPDDVTVVANQSDLSTARPAPPEEATLIARTGDIKPSQPADVDERTLVASTADLVPSSTEEPTRLVSSESLARSDAASAVEASPPDEWSIASKSSQGQGLNPLPQQATGGEGNHQSLGGPIMTAVLLIFTVLIAIIGFQAVRSDSNPGETLVEQHQAP